MKKAIMVSLVLGIMLCACGEASEDGGGRQTMEESEWNVYSYSETETGNQNTMNNYPVSNEDELKTLLEKAESELKAPSFIPEGYEFEGASLSYYVTKAMLDGLSPEEKVKEDGSVEYEYILPDDVLTQIDGFTVTYKNENGEEITIDADYVISMEMSTDGSGSFQEIEAANYEVSRAGILYDRYTGEFFRSASPIYEYSGGGETQLSCIFVDISMSDIENEQVVEIAESM